MYDECARPECQAVLERRDCLAVLLCEYESLPLRIIGSPIFLIKTDDALHRDQRRLKVTYQSCIVAEIGLHKRAARCQGQGAIKFGAGADKINRDVYKNTSKFCVGIPVIRCQRYRTLRRRDSLIGQAFGRVHVWSYVPKA